MTPQSLLKVLKATAEQKGYFLHADEEHCLATAEGLLENKERYGYLCCPCRLATSRDKDRDIICPCAYRDEDIREYGARHPSRCGQGDYGTGLEQSESQRHSGAGR